MKGGGKLFLGSESRVVGPGHFGRFDLGDGVEVFSYHYESDLDRGGYSVLAIRPLKPTIVSAAAVAPGIVLKIEPPADLAPGPLDVKVQSRAGRHELGARITDRANAIAIEIPPHWLLPGDYAVTLQPVEGGPPALLGFTVSAPLAER